MTLTSTLLCVVFPERLVSGGVGIQVAQRVLRDVLSLQDLVVPDDFLEGDLTEVILGEGLHRLHLRFP